MDEALAVGDAVFANRCVRKFEELRERKITVLFVSHDLGLVKQLSDRAILLLNGRMAAEGEPQRCDQSSTSGWCSSGSRARGRREERVAASHRHGDGTSEILSVEILDEHGAAASAVRSGDSVTRARADPVSPGDVRPDGGNSDPRRASAWTSTARTHAWSRWSWASSRPGEELEVDFRFDCWLTPQQYTLTVATQNADGTSHDWLDDVIAFDVVDNAFSRRAWRI